MPSSRINPRDYWDAKIRRWDESRHGGNERALPWIYRISRLPRSTHELRYQIARDYLAQHAKGKHVVEIGCSTGRLGEKIIEAGAAHYHGIDISPNAIELANDYYKKHPLKERVSFECNDVTDLKKIDTDFIFSVGVISWFTDEEVDHLFSITKGADYLHTTTERRFGYRQPLKWLHQIATGTHSYRVRYKSVKTITAIANRHGFAQPHVFRDPRLYANVFIGSRPFGK